ncbi:MAG: transketolase [Candidatus Thermoplasmatota archaeon]|nr:transketolase [Euryarchaeota archaeon]MBU4031764.1 transketolase [Candidatus Thermoplasmatota archaeon]MBU4072121.1 transketolase [Candidatus Thermoplasmatota archaeon]MBU4144998.1 transketolase [Candidatus Thermoplasmatota archaeon]MBU4592012.1 transketolase [Candidatus Thermoplasmatota archaeon]
MDETISKEKIVEMDEIARKVRRHIIQMIYEAGSGHPGGSLSAADVIVSLYFGMMNHKPEDPKWPDRDRFVLSKGHAAPALYGCLAESGYFPIEELKTFRRIGSRLQGHPDMRKTPGVEASTGSEGQGLSMGLGMALAGKLDRKPYTVYVMVGDGENDCGQIWEAAMAASFFKTDNLIAIIDRNMLQLDGPTHKVMSIEPLADKWRAFGWNVLEANGHNIGELLDALNKAKQTKGMPSIIIAHTIKGKGVSFMEGAVGFHGKVPSEEQYKKAMIELGEGTA